jgi:2-iminobutanoate/2-iminopropanoate deaminase
MTKANQEDQYLFFSSQDLIDYFHNNLAEKDLKTQTKRILEMARAFIAMKEFELEDIYSVVVMVRDSNAFAIVQNVLHLYFQEKKFPIGIIFQTTEMEATADIEIEFSVFKENKQYIWNEEISGYAKPFSPGIVIENYVHCSALSSTGNRQGLSDKAVEDCVQNCLLSIQTILAQAGTSLDKAYSFIVYLTNMDNLAQVERIFSERHLDREDIMLEVVKIDRLRDDHLLEISCSAVTN